MRRAAQADAFSYSVCFSSWSQGLAQNQDVAFATNSDVGKAEGCFSEFVGFLSLLLCAMKIRHR